MAMLSSVVLSSTVVVAQCGMIVDEAPRAGKGAFEVASVEIFAMWSAMCWNSNVGNEWRLVW